MPALQSLPLLLSFFSHKGGVGKTTCVQNIAYTLVSVFKLKVLVIDMDTQASLTGLMMQHNFIELAKKAKDKLKKIPRSAQTHQNLIHLGEKEFLERPKQEPNQRQTVFEVFQGVKSEACNYHLQWVQENFNKVLGEVTPITIPLHRDNEPDPNLNFLFIAGDRRIIDIDTELSEVYAATNSRLGFAPYLHFMPGLITSLIRSVGKKFGVDVILLDFGPAPSSLNRSVVMGSDYFAVNCLPDFLSQWSIESVGLYIKEWDEKSKVLRQARLNSLGPCPKFLGCIISRVKMRANYITNAKQSQISSIKQEMKNHLTKFGAPDAKFLENPSLIRDFTRLSDRADMIGKPISHIRPQDFTPVQKKKMNGLESDDISLGANINLNNYFAAIIGLFSNFSEEHHQALGNVFRLNLDQIFPEKDFLVAGPGVIIEIDEKDGNGEDKKRQICMKKQETQEPQNMAKSEKIAKDLRTEVSKGNLIQDFSGDIYCAFSRLEKSSNAVIKEFHTKKTAFENARKSLTEVVKEAKKTKISGITEQSVKQMPGVPQLHKLSYRISAEIDRNMRRKGRGRKKNPTESQEERTESQKNEEKFVEKYLNTYRHAREASAELLHHLRKQETVQTFLDPKTFPKNFGFLGEQSLTNFAHISSQKSMKIYVPNKTGKMADLYHEFEPSMELEQNSMILCETKDSKKIFSSLQIPKEKKKAQPAQTFNKNGKRGGQLAESSHEVVTKKRKGA